MTTSNPLLIHTMADVTVVNFNESSILDTLQVDQIGESLYELVDGRACRKIVLDFSKVRFLSSSALGVLIQLRKKAKEIKGRVLICGLRPELKRVFTITSVDRLFEFHDNESRALSAFGVAVG